MHPWQHALVLVVVILLLAVSFALLGGVIGFSSPWLVLLLMFYFLAIAKVAEPLFRLRMPVVLRPLRRWEMEAVVYRRFGVLRYGRLLRQTPLRHLNSAVYLDRERTGPLKVRLQAESAEASHFWAAILFLPYLVLAGLNGMWTVVVWFSLAQLLVNIYPILHLRYVRGRLDQILRRIQAAKAVRAGGRQRPTHS